MFERQFPEFPHPLPESVAGHRIIAAARIPAREGEIPDLAILIGQDMSRPSFPFTVWKASVRAEMWVAYQGDYDLTWSEAVAEFTRRLQSEA